MSDRTLDHRLTNFLGGLVGGVTAITLCSPFDIARTRYQIQNVTKSSAKKKYAGIFHSFKTILKEEGFKGFFKGYSAAIIAMPMFYSTYFTTYHHLKELLTQKLPSSWGSSLATVSSAAITTLLCEFLTSPLWVIRLRLQTQYLHDGMTMKYKGLYQAFGLIHKEEGMKAFYRGVMTSAFTVIHAAIFLPLYEYLREDLFQSITKYSSLNVILSSSLAKAIASTITYPQAVLRAALQENPKAFEGYNNQGRPTSPKLSEIVRNINRKAGLKGFYIGFTLDLVRVLPVNAVVFLTFELVREMFQRRGNNARKEASAGFGGSFRGFCVEEHEL